ncbi:glycosyltransferase [Colwellia sp. TT2012]|uniref:glycosyltransferase n=1 Tax=Colwellia sp. TT2012 TaxID=1720342 RepID=UPI00070B8F40|nr:glycosyltransferase [Colwellia sp. TT2012]
MNVLHIHQDYPDGRPYPFTKAVANLISSCELQDTNIKHTVVSINRSSNPFSLSSKSFEQGISIVYWAIPLPFLYYFSMKLSACYIHQKIKHLNIDLIHGHKLTSEGVLAYFLAQKMNKPYVLSVRGGSDMHNIRRLPQHKNLFSKVFMQAKKVFWVSAWAKVPVQKILDIDLAIIAKTSLLPNICNINLSYPQQDADLRHGYVTAVSYHQYKRKGLAELIEAIAAINKQNSSIELTVYGSGDAVYQTEIENLIVKHNAVACVHLKGQVSQQVLLSAMSQSKGFLLPAMNETFGMAYIEALSVGCPILYVENTGIDGYFNNVCIGEKITAVNVAQLIASITKIDKNNAQLCNSIKKYQEDNCLSFYTAEQVGKDYLNNLALDNLNSNTLYSSKQAEIT